LNSGNYYDDTTAFARMFQMAADEGTSPDYHPAIIYPYADMPKSAIVEIGRGLGVDYGQTWSCYRNGEKPCGTCDSCAQRQHAFHNAGLPRN